MPRKKRLASNILPLLIEDAKDREQSLAHTAFDLECEVNLTVMTLEVSNGGYVIIAGGEALAPKIPGKTPEQTREQKWEKALGASRLAALRETLREAGATFKKEGWPDKIFQWDRYGRYKIHVFHSEVSHYSGGGLVGKTVFEVLPPTSAHQIQEGIFQCLESKERQELLLTLTNVDQRLRVMIVLYPFRDDQVLGLAWDMAEQ